MDESTHLSFIKSIISGAQSCLEITLSLLGRLYKLNIILLVASITVFSFMVLGRYGRFFSEPAIRFAFLAVFVLVGAILLKASGFKQHWGVLFVASLLFITFSFKIASYATDISTYPFSLGWSEGSRYYYASLFFSEGIYDISLPPSVLHPSRYLMQSVPFLVPDSPIWSHRLWQVMLWVVTTLTTAFLLARRLSISDQLRKGMFISWVFLFLLLGPVFYHLQISAILVLLLFDHRKFGQSLLAVLLASAWAGFSRINWYPVPGMLAITLFLLETPVGKLSLWRYLIKPILWVSLGIAMAFISQSLYAIWSGNPAEQFASSFTSDLLWYRLLPNPTYKIGVLPAAILASSPFILLIADRMKGVWRTFHSIRILGIGSILFALFIGGIVVSTKIGGGSNLHNLDAYFVLLLVVTAYIFFGDFTPEHTGEPQSATTSWVTTVGLILALLLPVYITINSGMRIKPFNQAETATALKRINRFVRNARANGGEVLFIDERQLLTFQDVENTTLVPDYEKVFLSEMAMAGNEAYLSRFHDDIKNHRFSLIITEPLFIKYKGSTEAFGEENDVWVKYVSEPVTCYYKRIKILPEIRLQLLEPRSQPRECESD
jgi:hypothetical protein